MGGVFIIGSLILVSSGLYIVKTSEEPKKIRARRWRNRKEDDPTLGANRTSLCYDEYAMNTATIVRSAKIHWEGDVARGRGSITTGSGIVSAAYSFGTRFSNDPGTNPEELLGASHAACFTMALAAELTRAGYAPKSVDSEALVQLQQISGGYEIPQIDLTTHVVADGLTDEQFQELAKRAKENCPVSRALRAVPITLKATLAQ
jgi:lipoyl-dependent peroxiredoxin